MTCNNSVNNCVIFSLFGFINNIVFVDAYNRLVCRDFDNVELVNLSELGLLGHGGTCHARKLTVNAEEVLECNCRKGF